MSEYDKIDVSRNWCQQNFHLNISFVIIVNFLR